MKSEIERSLQGTTHHDILHQTDQEQLRHAQAENDGENDCEITELIHAAASALSLDKTSVDIGSLFCNDRRVACIILDFLQPTRLSPQELAKIDESYSGYF